MSNYDDRQDKIIVHLQELYVKHRTLDTEIKELYNHYARDEELNKLKTKKLWLKDEIHRLETELKALHEENI
jgi:hypothetical protein